MFDEAASRMAPRVVPLFFFNGPNSACGTGTILDAAGRILTANHVVPGDPAFSLIAGRNPVGTLPPVMTGTPWQVVARYPNLDLAIVECPGLDMSDTTDTIDFNFDRLPYGHPLGSFGYPQPHRLEERSVDAQGRTAIVVSVIMPLRFKSYYVAGIGRPDFAHDPGGPHQFITYQLDSFAYGGHSGGPVFDVEGRLVAVMSVAYVHAQGRYEISYCDAVAIENIRKELLSLTSGTV